VLFTNFADASNSGSGETDLYSTTLPVNTFDADGDTMRAIYALTSSSAGVTKSFRVHIAGTVVLDATGALTSGAADGAQINITAIRASSSVLRVSYDFITQFGTFVTGYTTVTSVNFGNTMIVKLTGQGSASTQVTARMAKAELIQSA